MHCIKLQESQSHYFPTHSWFFSFFSKAMNFFILSTGLFFKKSAYALLVFLSWLPFMQISGIILGVNIISRKVSLASANGAWWFKGVLRLQPGFFWGQNTLRKFFGSKEHLVWLKIHFNLAKMITVQNYITEKIYVNRYTHIQCSS